MASANFSCSFSDLGDTVRLGLFEYEEHQPRFAAHKPRKYTVAFGAESRALLQSFMGMDDFQFFAKRIEAARDVYYGEVRGVAVYFKNLKNFINELSSDKNLLNNYYKDAGQQLFNDLGANNLADNDKLLSTMIRFIQANQVALTEKDLPATFVQQLKDKQTSLKTTNKAWLDEKEAATAASAAKTAKGNELKNRMADIFLDAQTIFADEKEIAKKFVWEPLLTKVRGVRDAGFGGKTINKTTEKAAGNITVFIPALNLTVVSDANGRYQHAPIPEGVYDIEVTGEGFKPLTIEKRVVKAGVVGRLNIELEASVVPPNP